MQSHYPETQLCDRGLARSRQMTVLRRNWGFVVACAMTFLLGVPALGAPVTIGLGVPVTVDGKLFSQKYYSADDDRNYKGNTAFLPIIVSDRKLAFKLSGLDQGFLHGPLPTQPVDRIELTFKDQTLLAKHRQNEGKSARIRGALIIDEDNRLLPVKLEVSNLEIMAVAGKPQAANPGLFLLGRKLQRGARYSMAGHYVTFQADGNLCVYKLAGNQWVWCINNDPRVQFQRSAAVEMTREGRLVVTDANGGIVWQAPAGNPQPGTGTFITGAGALELRAPSGAVVWTSRGSSKIPKKIAASAENLDFEYFGSFNLSLWNKKPSRKGNDEGDVTTEIVTYEKEGMILEITSSRSEYGNGKLFKLKGADGKVRKTRSLYFSNDILEAEEVINDYTAKPARKYSRTQKMAVSSFQMKSIPTKLSGAWVQGPADKLR